MQDSACRDSTRATTPELESKIERDLKAHLSEKAVVTPSTDESSNEGTTALACLLHQAFFYDGPIAGNSPLFSNHQESLQLVDWPQGMRGYVLNLTLEGEGLVRDGERCFVCKPGDLILIPPHVPHFYHVNYGAERWVHQWIYFYPRSYWLHALNFPLALQELPSQMIKATAESTSSGSGVSVPGARDSSAGSAVEEKESTLGLNSIIAGDRIGAPYNPMSVVQQIAMLEQERAFALSAAADAADEAAAAQQEARASVKKSAPKSVKGQPDYGGKIGYFKVPQQMWDEITSLFRAIIERSFSPHAYSQLLASNYLEQILFRRLEHGAGRQLPEVDPRVALSCLYIRDNLSNNKMTIADIAAQVQLSPSRISHLFERHMGMSLIKWRDQERLKLVKSLLITTELKIEQIAAQVGIQDAGYFFKFFKRNCGLTPSQFRRDFKGKLKLENLWSGCVSPKESTTPSEE